MCVVIALIGRFGFWVGVMNPVALMKKSGVSTRSAAQICFLKKSVDVCHAVIDLTGWVFLLLFFWGFWFFGGFFWWPKD